MFARAQLIVFAIAGVFLASATPFIARDDPVCARTYEVVSGDTCDQISVAQNVSTYQLATVNAGVINADCTNLWVGEAICLGFEGADCSTVHLVAEGDSCEAITTSAGITFATLRANNPNIDEDCTNIYPGEVLCTAAAAV